MYYGCRFGAKSLPQAALQTMNKLAKYHGKRVRMDDDVKAIHFVDEGTNVMEYIHEHEYVEIGGITYWVRPLGNRNGEAGWVLQAPDRYVFPGGHLEAYHAVLRPIEQTKP